MGSQLYWIETSDIGRLAIMARPRAGDWLEDEVSGWRSEGVDVIVSLLEQEEVIELALSGEAALCLDQRMEFISFPIPDRSVPPSLAKATKLVGQLVEKFHKGKAIAIHCRAGIGRSSLMAACVLVSLGLAEEDVFERIGRARGVIAPDTKGQRDWLAIFEDATRPTS